MSFRPGPGAQYRPLGGIVHAGCGVKRLARSPFSTRIAAPIALLLPSSSALFAAFSGAIAVVLLTFPAEFIGPPAVGHSYIRVR